MVGLILLFAISILSAVEKEFTVCSMGRKIATFCLEMSQLNQEQTLQAIKENVKTFDPEYNACEDLLLLSTTMLSNVPFSTLCSEDPVTITLLKDAYRTDVDLFSWNRAMHEHEDAHVRINQNPKGNCIFYSKLPATNFKRFIVYFSNIEENLWYSVLSMTYVLVRKMQAPVEESAIATDFEEFSCGRFLLKYIGSGSEKPCCILSILNQENNNKSLVKVNLLDYPSPGQKDMLKDFMLWLEKVYSSEISSTPY